MEWSRRDNNDATVNTTTSTFYAAEEFARYIYHQWTTTSPNGNNMESDSNHIEYDRSSETSTLQNESISSLPIKRPHIFHMLLLIAKEDQMIYIARPIHNNKNHTTPTTIGPIRNNMNHRISSILTSNRLEQLLLQHMMIDLQHHQYVYAIQEFMSGIDFYMKYGPPKVFIWDRIFRHTTVWNNTNHHYHEQIYWVFIKLLISMAFVCINWYPLLQLYEHCLYHNIDHYYHTYLWMMFQKNDMKIAMQPLSKKEFSIAEQLRQKYHVQDSCPICLEQFTNQPPKTQINGDLIDDNNVKDNNHHPIPSDSHPLPYQFGSDHQPITLLRCGHVYDTSCWTKWMMTYHQYYEPLQPHDNHNRQPNQEEQQQSTQSRLKCLICQQPA